MTGDSNTCSYVRVEPYRSSPHTETVDVAGGLLFVDVASEHASGWEGEVADQLRFVDESALGQRTHVLVRSPDPFDDQIQDRIQIISDLIERRTGSTPPIGVVNFLPGEPSPQLHWSAPVESAPSLLATARAVELGALLKSGNAHWKPATFHYAAPSGEHRRDFIRVGDAIRSPRDATVLATWLYPYVATGRAIILDSSTLLPVVLALQAAAAPLGVKVGPVAVRDAYPHSLLQDEELVELTVGANGALAVLSVSSTGQTANALAQCLQARIGSGGSGAGWRLETLVHRTRPRASRWRDDADEQGEPWLYIPSSESFTGDDDCELCRSPDRAPYVRIDAATFANTSLPEPPIVVMPQPPANAHQIANLLEMYDDTDGIGIDCDPSERTRMRRTDRRWGVCFYPHHLLSHSQLIEALDEQLSLDRGDDNDGRVDLDKLTGVDAIVALDEDIDNDGFDRFVEWGIRHFSDAGHAAGESIPVVRLASDRADHDDAAVAERLHNAAHILVMAVGTVTGGTVQELLIRIHRALSDRPRGSYIVSGLVLHARPPSFEEWKSVRGSFSQRLVAMWMTYLPSRDHPLAEEQRLSRQTLNDDRLPPSAREYAQARRQWVLFSPQSNWPARRAIWDSESGAPNPAAVLMCDRPHRASDQLPRLLPNSLFGHRMSMVGTLVGVGAALHRRRLDQGTQGGPPGLRFDLSRIPTVYFEVPIICAVLRWIRPFEASWERTGRTVHDVLLEIWHRAHFEQPGSQATLLAELALAAAAGKIPRHAKTTIAQFFDYIEGDEVADTAPIDTARQLLEAAWGPLPEIGVAENQASPNSSDDTA